MRIRLDRYGEGRERCRDRRSAVVAMLALACIGAAAPRAPGAPSGADYCSGWVVYWDPDSGLTDRAAQGALFDEVTPFAYHFTPEGRLEPGDAALFENPGYLELLAPESAARVFVSVVNDVVGQNSFVGKSREMVVAILSSPVRRAEHIAELLAIAATDGVDGLEIDYEQLQLGDGELFSGFIEELAPRVRAGGRQLAVVVTPKTAETASRDGYQWARLGAAADIMRVLTYEEHGTWSGPGPIATPLFVQKVGQYALSQIPFERIVIALGVYGYDWPLGVGDAIPVEALTYQSSTARALDRQLRIQRDAPTQVPWYRYLDGLGIEHEVWFEDLPGLKAKWQRLYRIGIRKVAVWRLGGAPPGLAEIFSANPLLPLAVTSSWEGR